MTRFVNGLRVKRNLTQVERMVYKSEYLSMDLYCSRMIECKLYARIQDRTVSAANVLVIMLMMRYGLRFKNVMDLQTSTITGGLFNGKPMMQME